MQQLAAAQIGGLAQIQLQGAPTRLRLEAQAFLAAGQILLNGQGGRVGGNAPQPVSQHQLAAYQAEGRRIPHADDAQQGFVQFFEPGPGAATQGGEGFGQAPGQFW